MMVFNKNLEKGRRKGRGGTNVLEEAQKKSKVSDD